MVHLDLNMITIKSLKLFIGHVFMRRSLEVWGSPEALAREKKLRKKAEIEYRESKYIQFKAISGSFPDHHTMFAGGGGAGGCFQFLK